jgi:type IV pilus assembly protein PilO
MQDKHIIALASIVLIAAIYAFYAFIFVPQQAEIDQLSAQCLQEQKKVDTIEAFQQKHPNIKQYLAELDDNKKDVDLKLPDDSDMREFLLQAEKAAKESNLSLTLVKYNPVRNQKGYRDIPVQIEVNGNYFQTVKFIKNIENSPRFNKLQSVVMKMEGKTIKTSITSCIFMYGNADGNKGK